ncbi:MAG: exodeoxyribonuclease VII large subunit [Candidatus Kerfeldbacteria bacterium]|nr:exodeoxyribonuclease VII large subunit [Candidatus Kerfeldbacteria bacterium]
MRIYTVSEFRTEINELLGQVTVAIQGEISDFHISQNRFVWFSIVDDSTVLKCFMLAFKLQVPLEEGMEVRIVGSPTLFKKGQFVFQPRSVELVGEGSLQKAYELLKTKLSKEGLFDDSRKRSLPRFPRHIGLVTSRDAAAYTDVLRILNNRWSGLQIYHVNAQVQGAAAANSIVAALAAFNEEMPELDALILTRGGGSLEDLQAFNTEEVVRAIFASTIPVVSAVGHERDITLADLAADVRASTPSNAAELVVPHRDDVTAEIGHLLNRCERSFESAVYNHQQRLHDAVNTLEVYTRTQLTTFQTMERRLDQAFNQFTNRIQSQQQRIDHVVRLLESLNPRHILKRGFSLTLDAQGRVLKTAAATHTGDELTTVLLDGRVRSIVKK